MPVKSPCHLTDDQLLESYVLAAENGHLTACGDCRARYERLAGAFELTREDARNEADAIFTPERLHDQRDRIVRRLERFGHPAEVLLFPNRSGHRQAAFGMLGPARHWIAGAAAAGLVAGLFLGFAVDRRVGSISTRRTATVAVVDSATWQRALAEPQDEQILTDIEDVVTGPHRLLEMRVLDDMTTPTDLKKEASFVPR